MAPGIAWFSTMTLRSVVIGLLLASLISLGTYFNDWVIGQTQLIGNHLPISIFGLAAFLLLVANPLLRLVGKGLPLRGGEVAVITALGLTACAWPGSNFFRGFTTVTALPAHWYKTKASWQSAQVFSYVPGASAALGPGHVKDWKALAEALGRAREQGKPKALAQLSALLEPGAREALGEARRRPVDASRAAELTLALNRALRMAELGGAAAGLPEHEVVRHNRELLVRTLPAVFAPQPRGQGALFDGGRADPFALDTLIQGRSKSSPLSLSELPWASWWPTLRLWGGAAMLLSFAALCLALIVHPQWSKRELLAYPVARFVEETSARAPGAFLPDVARTKQFWLGFGVLVFWHLINGLHAWFDWVPEIPRNFDFWPLAKLFPDAVRVWGSWGFFGPTLYMSVIAFAFFMSTSVSFSLGIAQPLLMALGAVLLGYGVQLEAGMDAKPMNQLRFGAFLGVALIIAYTGRRYYSNVVASAFGGRRSAETPRYATWACRVFLVSVVLVVGLMRSAGLGFGLSALFVAVELVMFIGVTRAVAETGAFFVQASWAPVGVLTALLGFDAIGPTSYIVLGLASVILFIDSRELFMPYAVNALKIADRADGAAPGRMAPWMAGVLVFGFGAACAVTLYLQYNESVTQVGNPWGTDSLPLLAFDPLAQHLADAAARGSLTAATNSAGFWDSLRLVAPAEGAVTWLALGLALALGAAIARLRLPWWPLHPVAFLVWGTYPIAMFGPSFVIGWLVKAFVVGTTGARGYHTFRPLMVGIIAGELLSGLFWMIVGAAYYFVEGKAPVMYNIFPG